MTPPDDRPAQQLIEKWRKLADQAEGQGGPGSGECAYRECADDLALLIAGLPPQPERQGCVWTEDDEGVWTTACGEAWVFTEGYPWDNKARFCFACGQLINAIRYVEPPVEDECHEGT